MLDSLGIAVLTHGSSGLELAYAAVQVPMAVAMIRAHASLRKLLLSPTIAVPLTAASGLVCALMGPVGPVASLLFGTAVSAALGYGAGCALSVPRPSGSRHQRGTLVVDARGSTHGSRDVEVDASAAGQLPTLAGCRIPQGDETKHFKFIGTTGTGKSTAIRQLLAPALRRGDRVVIADPDGGYLRSYFDRERGDVILNPFDARSVKWDLFGEIQQPYDAEQLARSLLPDPESGDRTWCGYARTLLTSVLRQAHAAGVRDAGELYRLIAIAPAAELRTLTAGTPAQPFLEEHNTRMFDSIRSVASSAVASLEHVAQQRGSAFSVREWIRRAGAGGVDARQGGVLFIPYRADQIAALRSTVSAWMRIAIFEAMAGPEGDQRLWFVIDELDALGKIDGLKDALARVRKFGGRCILGFQSIAQVASTYGAGDAHTIVENCGNTLILRCSASEGGGTSRFASTLIGQREVLRSTHSRSRRADEFLGSVTSGEHFSIEPAVMDSEIEQLPDLAGYLKFASEDRWRRIDLAPRRDASIDRTTPAFVLVPQPPAPVATPAPAPQRKRPARAQAPRARAVPAASVPRGSLAAKAAPAIHEAVGLEP
ncbi:MAG TPA: type IV secretion system DNA-binding domain-containing protein [Steroidobacteraceae bacterium]|jgi:hypothetical protein|nr:type IV secretion system DNA-binding domain-containing protein [Steroidobacteraceae bacterium]